VDQIRLERSWAVVRADDQQCLLLTLETLPELRDLGHHQVIRALRPYFVDPAKRQ